jgi:hypothetical protein
LHEALIQGKSPVFSKVNREIAPVRPPLPSLTVRYVETLDALPTSDHAICVAFGKTDGCVQNGNRYIICVNAAGLSEHLAAWRLRIAVETAKRIARREGIEMIHVCRKQPDRTK